MSGRFEKRGPVGVILVDNPPVNAISQGVRLCILDGLKQAEADADVKAVVIACAGRTFMAGADIAEFKTGPKEPHLPDVIAALDQSSKPLVAAIHGTAFGGGLEIALGCNYRVAVRDAKVGLPEVKLGILPGAGGTQRLPRLIGVEKALPIILSGDPIPAPKAAELGIIDKVVEGDLMEAAIAFAEEKAASGGKHPRISEKTIDRAALPETYFDDMRRQVAKEKRNLFSPQRIVDAVEAAATLSFDDGMAKERQLFMACAMNSQARALQHVFFAERQVAKIPNIAEGVTPREIKSVAVIGAGTMGGGIAMNFANAGIPVTVLEVSQEGLERGLGVVRKNYERSASRGKLTAAQVEERMALLKPTLSYDDLKDADLIIEAVFETLEVKKQVFTQLDRVAKPGAILASNTSYLSIDTIASYTSRPQDVLGMHFFSPANVMKLLEIVRGEKTASDVLATALTVAKTIRKVGVVAGNCHGFIGNRMLQGYGREAGLLVLEGATPSQVDKALYDFGMPMGVLQMGDLAGLDIGYRSRKDQSPDAYEPKSVRVADRLVEMGRCGQKTSGGYYDYEPGDRTPKPSEVTQKVIDEVRAEYGITPRAISDQEIIERCFLAMVNIGCEVLREGIAYRASDIDIVYLYGYGFPAYRGGPMFWAENEIGLRNALEKIKGYAETVSARWWQPSPLLERLVAEGKGFASLR
ncbi:3-hydroxyacyl-CoA dehydrogenase NAD-binding domain-containing protein [Pedomonas mirosovicensis]|uniref:3-hydroxyacyl-CoA dehydrogenase NAD-binding domain-containing protein n=1 Tax=Pedomonas mirosovicensis TaxID=2908641 RepID=UPI00216780E0|nr:3-hydroxyacyl-CoA dehydrogenase NAD-binding domain-containing protein [Pedomonas mirosovicensis]MCH8685517.1 3-hydroxyacyl-CoA dehydrogenase NAD-binding domain-containing protein [Pedomonas mirosovicensis]